MSYDISLCNSTTGSVLPTEHFTEGGTHKLYGVNECDLNVTYNYSEVLSIMDFNLRELHGQTAGESLSRLQGIRRALGGDRERPPRSFQDYWAPTPGNVLVVINRLITFAEEHPTGIWRVT